MSRPEALDWAVDTCTIAATLEVIGDRWSWIVLREAFHGVRRFDDFTVRTSIPRQVLTDRLRTLVASGILRRAPSRDEGQRSRDEYRLTDQGLDLYPVFMALQAWGDRYLVEPDGPPQQFTHRDCGASVHLEVHCDGGHLVGESRDVVGRLGPGARRRVTGPPAAPASA